MLHNSNLQLVQVYSAADYPGHGESFASLHLHLPLLPGGW